MGDSGYVAHKHVELIVGIFSSLNFLLTLFQVDMVRLVEVGQNDKVTFSVQWLALQGEGPAWMGEGRRVPLRAAGDSEQMGGAPGPGGGHDSVVLPNLGDPGPAGC